MFKKLMCDPSFNTVFVYFIMIGILTIAAMCGSQIASNHYISKYAIENGYEQTIDGRWVKGDNNEN